MMKRILVYTTWHCVEKKEAIAYVHNKELRVQCDTKIRDE